MIENKGCSLYYLCLNKETNKLPGRRKEEKKKKRRKEKEKKGKGEEKEMEKKEKKKKKKRRKRRRKKKKKKKNKKLVYAELKQVLVIITNLNKFGKHTEFSVL